MRAITRRMAAVGVSPWIFTDHRKDSFGAALAFIPSSAAALSATVQHAFDQLWPKTEVRFTRAGTVATLIKPNHGLSVSDYLSVENAGAPFDGEYPVASVVDVNSVTFTVVGSGATAAAGKVGTLRVFDHELMTGMTARTDGNYAFPPTAVRLSMTAYTSGFADLVLVQQG